MPPLSRCALALLTLPVLGHAEGLLALDNPALNTSERAGYASVQAFEGNDAVPMRSYTGDWSGAYSPRDGVNLGLLAVRAEAGAQWDGWRLGLLYRAQALVQTNRDTTDLARQYNTQSGYDSARSYAIDYQLNGFEAQGLRLGKSRDLGRHGGWQWQGGLAASLLQGIQAKLESASGQVTALGAQDVNANIATLTQYSAMDTSGNGSFSPFLGTRSPSALGYALDLGIHAQRADGLVLDATVNDLAAALYWHDLPSYAANYNTATKYYSSNGFVQFHPSASSTSSYQNLTQTLAPQAWLSLGYPLGRTTWQAATSYTQGYWFPELGASRLLSAQWTASASWDTHFNTLALGLHNRWFAARLQADSLNPEQAKATGFSLSFRLPF